MGARRGRPSTSCASEAAIEALEGLVGRKAQSLCAGDGGFAYGTLRPLEMEPSGPPWWRATFCAVLEGQAASLETMPRPEGVERARTVWERCLWAVDLGNERPGVTIVWDPHLAPEPMPTRVGMEGIRPRDVLRLMVDFDPPESLSSFDGASAYVRMGGRWDYDPATMARRPVAPLGRAQAKRAAIDDEGLLPDASWTALRARRVLMAYDPSAEGDVDGPGAWMECERGHAGAVRYWKLIVAGAS
jgi:hypothetical protein